MWAHESRAVLEPLRFSTHERSGVGSESGLAGELFSRFFSLIFSREFRPQACSLAAVGSKSDGMAGHVVLGFLK